MSVFHMPGYGLYQKETVCFYKTVKLETACNNMED